MAKVIKEWDDVLINFTPEELMCKATGGYKFHPAFATKLQLLRTQYGKPIHPTSCCRSEKHNNSLPNSSKRSLHIYDKPKRGATGACAVDVEINDSTSRHEFLTFALALGFSFYYINDNPNYIHIDLRSSLGEAPKAW